MASAHVSDSKNQESGVKAGITADAKAGGGVTPSLEYHVQQSQMITVERDMKSWRRGVSVEECMPSPLTQILRSSLVLFRSADLLRFSYLFRPIQETRRVYMLLCRPVDRPDELSLRRPRPPQILSKVRLPTP